MSIRDGKITQRAQEYLARVETKLDGMAAEEIAERVRWLVDDHEVWRGEKCLNLNAAEAVMSRKTRRLLASDLATRVTEGFPGDKEYPAARQNEHIDEIEAILITLVKKLFRASYVEWRPVSTSMANASIFFALTKPGDVILSQRPEAGGNYSYNVVGAPRVAGLEVHGLPSNDATFEVDVEATREIALDIRPRLIVIGGSNVLFPYPVRELRQIADESESLLIYDGAHLGLLVATGVFQDPLAEGADLVTLSTHKIMSGAVGGLVLMNRQDLAERVLSLSFPTFMQTRDQNKYAATAHALAEILAFGNELAPRIVANAKALARALEAEGFRVLAADRGYTETHQVFIELDGVDGKTFESRCQNANILVSKSQHVGKVDEGGESHGARLTTQEVTRQGMTEEHMARIARLIRRVGIEDEPAEPIARDVEDLVSEFHRIRYSFDD